MSQNQYDFFQGFRVRAEAWARQQDSRMKEMRLRAEENPGDLNTAGFPDWAVGTTAREKKLTNAVLSAMEKRTGRDLSAYKKD